MTDKIPEATRGIVKFGASLREMQLAAFDADPGLGLAWELARADDPAIGWLDVAAAREKALERNKTKGEGT